MQSGIFAIIASSPGCKLFMESIQCKQVRAHILFSLTALGLDHADIQLLRDLFLSLQTLKEGFQLQSVQWFKAAWPLAKAELRVQWVNMLPLSPALTPTWPRRCKVISDMKADRSPEQRHGRVPLSLCRNMEECEQQRPLVILTQADISLMPCFWGCREGCLSSQTLRLRLKNCRALLQWEAWIAPLPSAIWSWSFLFLLSDQCRLVDLTADGQRGYSSFCVSRIKPMRENNVC